jgi:PAS domain S-box-containing protein
MSTERHVRHTNGRIANVISDDTGTSRVTVLAVDDDPDILDLTATFLERERDEFEVVTENFVDDALGRLEDERVDAIVSDYDMPRMNGLEFLDAIRENHEDIPFILFTGKGSEEIASEAISKGVTDYLQKKTGASQYSILANRILNAVDQYRASEALKRSEEKFSKLVTNSSDVIGVVNENARFKYISPACKHALGYEQEELIDECAFDYMPPDDRKNAMEAFFEAIENPEVEPKIHFRFEHPDGGWTAVEARGKNLFDDDFIDGFVVNARDITELKQREQELQQQNEQLKNMRQVLSHDLRSPVSVASGFMDLYRETNDESYLDKVDNALDRMNVLLDQMLTLADNDTKIDETEQISLKEIVRSAWEMAGTEEAELRVEDSREFEADPVRFQQVVENLLRNAIEHGDGDVTVTVGTTDSGIYFEDTGPGIDPEDRERVFESGYTTSADGTGFGLNIVKQIVLGHGWEIDISEGEAGGARFDITGVTFRPTVYN